MALPDQAPHEWRTLSVHIMEAAAARQAEYRCRVLGKSHAVRIYTDGSRSTTRQGDGRLGAAFVAYSHQPAREWESKSALSADHQGIDDAELFAILMGIAHVPSKRT